MEQSITFKWHCDFCGKEKDADEPRILLKSLDLETGGWFLCKDCGGEILQLEQTNQKLSEEVASLKDEVQTLRLLKEELMDELASSIKFG